MNRIGLLVFLLVVCVPFLVVSRLEPMDWYEHQWYTTLGCADPSSEKRFEDLEFYVVEDLGPLVVPFAGLFGPPNKIFLLRGFEDNPIVVKHEMLHALLFPFHGHGSERFIRCDPLSLE